MLKLLINQYCKLISDYLKKKGIHIFLVSYRLQVTINVGTKTHISLFCQGILTHGIKVTNNKEKNSFQEPILKWRLNLPFKKASIITLSPLRDSGWEKLWFSTLWIRLNGKLCGVKTQYLLVQISGHNTGCGSMQCLKITGQPENSSSELSLCLKKRKLITTENSTYLISKSFLIHLNCLTFRTFGSVDPCQYLFLQKY